MRRVILLALAAAACGDNTAGSVDAPRGPDATGARDAPPRDGSGRPDLKLLAAQMDGTVVVTEDNFVADDCEIVEACVDATGLRRLLRFDTVTENVGTADLDLGPTPPAGVSSGIFVWSPCHMHHHVAGFADYELRDGSGVVARGRKQAFCLEDTEQVSPVPGHGYSCMNEGISVGWADVYSRYTQCQWIDVTNVPSGTYTLSVTVDSSGVLPDADPTNNAWTTSVTL